MTEKEMPVDVDFSDDEVVEASKRAVLNNGNYHLVISEAENDQDDETGDLLLKLIWSPLKEVGNLSTKSDPNVMMRLTYPFKNKKVEGHKVRNLDKVVWRWLAFLRGCIDPTIPDYPRTIAGSLVFEGREIPKENYQSAKEQVNKRVMEKAKEIYSDPGSLVNNAAFAEAFENGEYTNLRNFSQEQPETLVKPEDFRAFRS